MTAVKYVLFLALNLSAVTGWSEAGEDYDPQRDHEIGLQEYNRQNLIEAMDLLGRAARAGYAPAQATLSIILDASEENEQAFHWFNESARQGDPIGQFGLANMYATGEGLDEPDFDKAQHWMLNSAEQDNLDAIRTLVLAYREGHLGLEVNDAEALRWMQRGAELKDNHLIRMLAQVYAGGELGVEKNPDEAARLQSLLPRREDESSLYEYY